jgi:glutathione S-transferase
MKLFIQTGSCSISPQIIANEIGVNLELINVDMATRRYGDNDYYKVSTFAMVPALVIDEKITLHETTVISVYLADKKPASQLIPLAGTFVRVRVMEMLFRCFVHLLMTKRRRSSGLYLFVILRILINS